MRNHADIVKTAGIDAVAVATGASVHTVRSWVQRDALPAEHWKLFADGGWATLEELADGVKPRKPRADEQAQAAA